MPSQSKMKKELSTYWESVKASAVAIKIVEPSNVNNTFDKTTTVGHCDDYGHPEAKVASPPIEPNCKKQFGCLYCEHYAIHADDEDIHKLFCLSYVVKAVREYIPEFKV